MDMYTKYPECRNYTPYQHCTLSESNESPLSVYSFKCEYSNRRFDQDFLPQYKGQPPMFWADVSLLQADEYWTNNKLNERGINLVKALKERHEFNKEEW